jgi:hypothetical protein
MAKRIKKKKTYKELIAQIGMLSHIIEYYRDRLETLGILIENYIHMNGDEKKVVKYIEKRSKEVKKKWNENKENK